MKTSFVVCDGNVYRLWHHLLEGQVHHVLDEPQESKKTLACVAEILDCASQFPENPWLIIGGGITCDLAAFAASLVKQLFVLVPTSLLAMVDASVGGKTGVNFPPFGKNMVGSFAFPQTVLIYTQWLRTLPPEEFYAGGVEALKHAFLQPKRDFLVGLQEVLINRDPFPLAFWIPKILHVKIDIVTRDLSEKGERAVLNLGHTTAHALEAQAMNAQTAAPLSHGMAVGLGLVFESFLSCALGYRSPFAHKELVRILQNAHGLRSRSWWETQLGACLETNSEKLCHHMFRDKKKQIPSDRIPFVLLAKNGETVRTNRNSWVVHVPAHDVHQMWKIFCASNTEINGLR